MYFRVYLDYILLSYEKPFDELMTCRNALQDREELSVGTIEDKVREFFPANARFSAGWSDLPRLPPGIRSIHD
jgi:hypothetical protein